MNDEERNINQWIVQKYQQDEQTMILLFAQWCVNHHVNALSLYRLAYPEQPENLLLKQALKLTLPAEESPVISTELLQEVLLLFEQVDLAQLIIDISKKEKHSLL